MVALDGTDFRIPVFRVESAGEPIGTRVLGHFPLGAWISPGLRWLLNVVSECRTLE
jgi:hypothetical protein